MIPVVVIRPEPGCAATLAKARALGLEAAGFPLFAVRPLPWRFPDEPFDAVLLGSANAVRHGSAALDRLRGKPAYVVGSATAEAAAAAGLRVVAVGKGSLQDLLVALEPDHRTVLRLCGKDRTELVLPSGVQSIERTVYASDPLALPEALVAQLRGRAVVLLHSASAARHFAQECTVRRIDRSGIALAALAPRIAAAAGNGWQQVVTAPSPDDAALLALARRMCHNRSNAG